MDEQVLQSPAIRARSVSMTPRQLLRGLVISCLLIPGFASAAEPGLSTDEVRIGMVNAQSGPAAALGLGMLNGAQAYFKRVNAEGGVHGRRINLLSRDDGYEPSETAAPTRRRAIGFAGAGALPVPLYRRRVFTHAGKILGVQHPRLLYRGNRATGRARDPGPKAEQDRHPDAG